MIYVSTIYWFLVRLIAIGLKEREIKRAYSGDWRTNIQMNARGHLCVSFA